MYDVLLIFFGLIALILGGNWLLKAAVGFSLRLNIPKIIIGMTVVSFATSAPELIVSVKSALNGHADLALGNVVGSNIANIGLVLGITILLGPIQIQKSFYKVDWPVMMFSSVLLYLFIVFDGDIVEYEGVLLVILLIAFLVFLLRYQKNAVVDEVEAELDEAPLPFYKDLLYMLIGGIALWGGSEMLINGAIDIAEKMDVSTRVIGITVVSIGTSIPELAASIIAVLKKEKAISLGNLLGSNIFNILAVLGITSMIKPLQVTDQGLLTNDILWMLGMAFVVLVLVFVPSRMKLGRREGLILLSLYAVFIFKMVTSNSTF